MELQESEETNCPIDFTTLNYTVITSQCKAPEYNATLCCSAFKEFACPLAPQINNIKNNTCALSMFKTLHTKGNYKPDSNQIQLPPKIFGKDYNLSYSPYRDLYSNLPQNCSRSLNNSLEFIIEYIFSFQNDSPQLSLLSISYSSELVARPDCFANWTEVLDREDGNSTGNSTEVFDRENGKGKMVRAKRQDVHIIWIAVGSSAFIVACLILIVKLRGFKNCAECILSSKHRPQGNIEMLLEKYGSFTPKRYKYAEVKKITSSFQDTLGKGGFGTVYRGRLQDGCLVAVKILHNSSSDLEELLNEILSISCFFCLGIFGIFSEKLMYISQFFHFKTGPIKVGG
ncbi:putative receptor-like protein kinase [Carex littledalei]|uniref:Putative receptor-like protein kinase n=1 Tax=Carex littledalei TaxID=544730 RepID=A0A833QQ69_9POAL|nr:putative receptor-like protein kinase [Carex littledalei]